MSRLLLTLPAFLALAAAPPNDPAVIDPMDALRFAAPKANGRAEVVPGKVGSAVRFAFDKDARGVFFTSNTRGTPAWDAAAGFSFWVKGTGADGFGGLEFIYDNDYAVRYDLCFPVTGTDWTKVTVAWGDLVPVLPKGKPLDPAGEFRPSKLSGLWVGKWWYWGDYPATTFTLDDVRLEPSVDRPPAPPRPAGDPLQRVRDKLAAGKPVTVVTMGDSLTDVRHWANRTEAWPNRLRAELTKRYGSDVTVVNPAIGGTQLRQNLVLIPRWLAATPEPDLVTICFGANDWEAGMRKGMFRETCADAVNRVRRATRGTADVLLMTTIPGVDSWQTRAELAEDVRLAAGDTAAGLADTEKAFLAAGTTDRARLFASDKVHLGPEGHALAARTVLAALAAGEK